MKCGHCKLPDVTVDHVRACSGVVHINPATDKQIKFLKTLLADRDHGFDESTQKLQLHFTVQSRKDTSKLIDHLLTCSRKAVAVTLEDGIYTKDGIVYRVYHTVHGANQQVVSQLNPEGERKKDKFTYLGKAPLAFLTAADLMPFDAACELSSAYGFCIACGTILHNDKSVELGIGPVCRSKFA